MRFMLTSALILLMHPLLAMPQELSVTVANFSTRLAERGRDVMTLLRVPESCSWQCCTSWSFPTSIVVAGESYRVKGDVERLEFSICSLVGTGVVARGGVAHWTTVTDARIGGFGKTVSSCSTLFADVVKDIDMVVIGPQTNMIYLASRLRGVEGTLMCRNLNLCISGPTNHLDFAVSLMNAGLVASEREPVQPRTVRRWEPTAEELLQWYFGRPRQPNTP